MSKEVASLFATIGADLSGFTSGLKQMKSGLSGASGMMKSAGMAMAKSGAVMTATVTAPLVLIGKQAVNTAATFESQMNVLTIAARSSGTALEDLSTAAIQVGADTELVGIDASQAADAMTNFYKAGLTTSDIFSNLNGYLNEGASLTGALRAAIDLAAASEMDLASASDAVAIAMATFNKGADEAGAIADNFVAAADASVTSVGELVDAMTNVGPTMAAFGYTLEDTNTALAILSQRGIRGAEAGTALKSMMTNMMRPTTATVEALQNLNVELYDQGGALKTLPVLLGEFQKGLEGATEQQRNQAVQAIAGTYGMKAMQTLLAEGTQGWADMAGAVGDAAGAQEVGAARTKGFQAAMEQLEGAIETLMIKAMMPLLQNTITPLVEKFTDFTAKVIELDPKLMNLGITMAAVAAAAGPVLTLLGGITIAIGSLLSPVGLAVIAVTALAGAFVAMKVAQIDIAASTEAVNQAAVTHAASYEEYVANLVAARRALSEQSAAYLRHGIVLSDAAIIQALINDGLMMSEEAYRSAASATIMMSDATMLAASSLGNHMQAINDASQAVQQFASEAQIMAEAMENAMQDSQFVDMLEDQAERANEIFQDMTDGFKDATQKSNDSLLDLQFKFNLASQRARQEYQNEYSALMAAGHVDEANELTAKYNEQEAMAAREYNIQEQLQARSLLQQKVVHQRAYVEELNMQLAKIKESLRLQVLKITTSLGYTREEQMGVLRTLKLGGEKQLQAEKFIGEQSVKIYQDSGIGVVNAAMATARGVLAAKALEVDGAGAYLKQLENDLANFTITLPDMPEFNLGDIFSGGSSATSAASSTKAAAEPATKALEDVATSLDKAIGAVKDALDELPDLEIQPNTMRGLNRMGAFLKRAITKVYGWFDDPQWDLKKKLKAVQDYLAPLTEIFQLMTVDLSNIVPMDDAGFSEKVTLFFAQVEMTTRAIMDWLNKISANETWREALVKAAELTDYLLAIFELTSIELSNIVPVDDDGFMERVKGFFTQLESTGIIILDYLRKIADNKLWTEALHASAAIADSVVKVFKVLSIDLSGADTALAGGFSLQGVKAKLGQIEKAGIQVLDYLRKIADNPLWAESLMWAAAISDNVVKVFDVLGIDLSGADTALDGGFSLKLIKVKIGQIEDVGREILDYLRKIADNPVWLKSLTEASALAEKVGKVFELINIDLENIKTGSPDKFHDNIDLFFSQIEEAGSLAMDWLRKIANDPVWVAALDAAAPLAENIKKIFDILSVDLGVKAAPVGFLTRLTDFLADLKSATPLVKQGIQDVAGEWKDTEALVADAGLVDSIKGVFDILSLRGALDGISTANQNEEGKVKVPLLAAIQKLFRDLKEVLPTLTSELQAMGTEWGAILTDVQPVVDIVANVFRAIAGLAEDVNSISNDSTFDMPKINAFFANFRAVANAAAGIENISLPTAPPSGGIDNPGPYGGAAQGVQHEVNVHIMQDQTVLEDLSLRLWGLQQQIHDLYVEIQLQGSVA